MATLKRIAKIFGIVLLVLFLGTLILYWVNNQPEPGGVAGPEADQLAQKMMASLNKEAWDSTAWVKWSFRNAHFYTWYKEQDKVEVKWDDYRVLLHTPSSKAQAFKGGLSLTGSEKGNAVKMAKLFFNNDSFWLIAPFKAFDPGTKRSIVETKEGKKALKVKYHSGGDTPGDVYLWHLDAQSRPTSFQMWVQIIPIGGVLTNWSGWQSQSTGFLVALNHKIFGRESDIIQNVSAGMDPSSIGLENNPFSDF